VGCKTGQKIVPITSYVSDAHKEGNPQSLNNDSVKQLISSNDSTGLVFFSPDSITKPSSAPTPPSPIQAQVQYQAKDSLVFDARNLIMQLFDSTEIHYEKIELKAYTVTLDLNLKQLWAYGDTANQENALTKGKPFFKEGEDAFNCSSLAYNFNSGKGLITDAVTQEGEIWLHGAIAKKDGNDVLYIKNARFTTCTDPEHPHFDIATSKAKVMMNDKVVTGPAVLRIEGVPTPLALPFGFFPSQTTKSSGIILPEYGEQQQFGFFLRNFGYHLSVSDRLSLTFFGDIFTSLSFGLRTEMKYNTLYKHDGMLNLKFSQFQTGDPQVPEDFNRTRDFSIQWVHNQSPKAHPTFNFKSNVNIQTGGFNRLNAASVGAIVQNQFSSNISFTKIFTGTPINVSAGLRHFQNTANGQLTLSLPEMVVNMSRINPLRRKILVGKPRWYENIGMTYRMQLGNQITTLDSLFIIDPLRELEKASSGIRHELNLNTNLTLLKYIFFTPGIRYDERWAFKRLEKRFNNLSQSIENDTLNQFNTTRQVDITATLSTNVFSTVLFKGEKLKGLRHTLTPNLTFLYRPDLGDHISGYYGTGGQFITYSPSQIGLYGSVPQGQSGQINLGFQNRVEAKLGPARQDSTGKDRRVPIIEQLSVNSSYDLARDSLNLSNLNINGRTTLFKSLGINLDMSFDPYSFITENGRTFRINKFEWSQNNRFYRLTTAGLALTYNIRGQRKSLAGNQNHTEEQSRIMNDPFFNRYFVDFNIPYSFNINYNIRYIKPFDVEQLTHTIGLSGDVNLTPKWKFAFNLNYDIQNGTMATSSFDLHRDLHCWEMRFSVIPFGFRQSYSFTINVKSALLQSLKINRQQGWFNN